MLKEITGKYKVCGVIGEPIEHTLSPMIHNTINEYYKNEMVYVPFHVSPLGLHEAIRGAHALGIRGLNVTMPHKKEVIKDLIQIDEAAKKVEAVNTLVYEEAGYKGYNTDIMGLKKSMEVGRIEYTHQNVAIIGSGGASYAAVECVIKEAKSIHLFNRTVEKAYALKLHFEQFYKTPIFVHGINEEVEVPIELVIQTTGVGMGAYKNQMPECALALLDKAQYAVDLIYNPWETLFLKTAKEKGCKVINGFDMLFYQGVRAYELMNHCELDEKMVDEVKAKINDLIMR